MNELTKEEELNVENLIYEIRGKQVMLDRDLAKLYQCKNGTKTINLAVSRHIERFPERFMFRLTEEECRNCSRFQFETLNKSNNLRGYNIKYLPYAFTEQGIAMLATILKTDVAVEVSIRIMDAFVAMKRYISNSFIEQKYINEMVLEHNKDIKLLKESFKKFEEKKKVNEIYFHGQIYDAYSKILDIMKKAKKELIIIDRYADKTVLDMIRNLKINVILITKKNGELTFLDIDKYNEEYNNLKIIYDNNFHDRYFILDKKTLYHSGTSINHAGSKTFSINKITDKTVLINLLNDLKEKLN